MAECKICESIRSRKNMIYEDRQISVFLKENPATAGHIIIVPKNHYAIMEQIPDEIVANMFNIANKFSIILFETLKSEGTNIIVQNGVPAGQKENHFIINVIARRKGDGIGFQWPANEVGNEELSTAKLKIEEEARKIIPKEKSEQIESFEEKMPGEVKEKYLLDSLRRTP